MGSISVVMPTYNADKTIAAALDSVFSQTEPADEVIVVDDGSTDGTALAAGKFGRRVKLIRQRNQGAAVARQAGTAAATSDYIAYLDADDWWPENKIARCKEIVASEAVDLLLADLRRARPGDGPEAYLPKNSSYFPWAREYFSGRAVLSGLEHLYKSDAKTGLALLLRGFPVYPSAMLVSRRAVAAVGGWDARFRRCQDFDIGLRLARRFPLYYLDEVQALLGYHGANEAAYPYFVMQTEGDIRVLQAHWEAESPASPYRGQVAAALGRKYDALAYVHRKAGHYALAQRSYAQAWRWPGRRIKVMLHWCYVSIRRLIEGDAESRP